MIKLCKDFYNHSANLERINWANIVLIPKNEAPVSVSDYRPISLINAPLKIISKILATRLSKVIDRLVDHSQSAFIKGRSIMDNVVAAEEIIFSLQKRRLDGNIAKVDFARAFDMVDWDFLLELLEARGFGPRWRHWIANLLFTSKASILINGSPEGYVRYQRGLRQGDPLSPLLFVLVADVLSVMFNHALDSHILHGVPLGISVLAINLNKTCLLSTGFNSLPSNSALGTLNCAASALPITYLGVPIAGRRPRRQDWEVLILKVKVRLTSWKANYLSVGGRLTLINSVLTALPTYLMSIFRLPKWVVNRIDRLRRDFLWKGPDIDRPKCRLVNWHRLCLPRDQGGWGIINLEEFNCALLGKWWWKVLQNEAWCGSAPILFNYFHQHSRWNLWLPRNRRCSFFWKGLFPSLEAFKAYIDSSVGNGNSTLFWLDNWYNGQAPKYRWCEEFLSTTSPFATVRDMLLELPSAAMRRDPLLIELSSRITSGFGDIPDHKSWKLTSDGSFSVKSFYKFLIDRGLRCSITPVIFKRFVPQKIAAFMWLVWDRKILTLDTLFARALWLEPSGTASLSLFPSHVPLCHARTYGDCGIESLALVSNCLALWLLEWFCVVPAREMHKLEESIAAVRRCIQFSSLPREEQNPNRHDEFPG
ncbi:uncharacterized protein LOC120284053 [Dioscorea cayenensis subsp. rotundata]|uniref:Uncharacterized protein LOC120284053 n=1 Tax=Dioscorea cayennensis subsp. rotundata TaxID=55577 RepID=A0AB40D3A4_DIOCR|nr:uncharacterized protein LOC120284053 [Dioscorea cayenensis subsp. rotundata]